jgi:SHS2 domain-containing protein
MYELLPHKADVIIRGIGGSFEEAFCEAAKAMFSVMVELADVKPIGEVKIEVRARNMEELLIAWLNELLSEASLSNVLFNRFEVKIEKENEGFVLKGIAYGEKIDPEKHKLKTEVKGATYSGLKVAEENGKFIAQCVVDV